MRISEVYRKHGIELLFAAMAVLYSITPIHNGNIFWHLRNGLDILETGEIRTEDPFTWTRHGVYWIQHEWLAETAMAASWKHLGEAGPVLLKALFIGLSVFLAAKAARKAGGDPYFILIFGAFWLTLAQPRWIARPHFFSIFFFSVYLYVLSFKPKKPWKLALVLLPFQILWVNVHAGFVMGVFLSAVPAMDRFFRGRFREMIPWMLPPAVLLLASGIHPNGFRTLEYLPSFLNQPLYKESIREWWSPFDPRYAPERAVSRTAILFVSLTLATALLLAFRRGKLERGRLAALGILVASTAFAARNGELLAPAMLAWIPGMTGVRFPRWTAAPALIILALIPLVYGVPREIGPPRQLGARVDWSVYPVELADLLEEYPGLLENSVLFNTNEISGYLEYRFAEALPLFLDGRCLLFPEEFHRDYLVLAVSPGRDFMAAQYELFSKYGFNLLVYNTLQEGSSVYLAAMLPEFRPIHIDGLVAAYASTELLDEAGAWELAYRHFDPLDPNVLLSNALYMMPSASAAELRRAAEHYTGASLGSLAQAIEYRDDTTMTVSAEGLPNIHAGTVRCWEACRSGDLEGAAEQAMLSGDTELETAVRYLQGYWPGEGETMFGVNSATMRTDENRRLAEITALWLTGQTRTALAAAELYRDSLNAWGTAQCAVFNALSGNDQRASELIDEALEMGQGPMVLHRAAIVLSLQGRWDSAAEHCRRALTLSPGFTAARLLLANCLWETGRMEEAASEYEYLSASGVMLPSYARGRLEFILSVDS